MDCHQSSLQLADKNVAEWISCEDWSHFNCEVLSSYQIDEYKTDILNDFVCSSYRLLAVENNNKNKLLQWSDDKLNNFDNYDILQACDTKDPTKSDIIQRHNTQLDFSFSNHNTSQNCDTRDTSCETIQRRDNQLDNFPNHGISQNCDIQG